jgi:two-component system sensor histidine kinase PhoQ
MLNFSTAWITNQGEQAYIFQIAENKNVLNSQLNIFQKNLWGWLAGVSLFLIIIQVLILRWGLKPLRHVADDLLNIEKGKEKNLSGNYPKEIDPLAKNLNKLLDSSSQQLARYRDGLGNMAHSLKTPVAVLQGIIENATITQKDIAIEQLKTINNIVDYQLQRASTAGRSQLGHVIPLLPITNKIISTLNKVYQHKQIQSEININSSLNINIDEGDLYELLGNLLENAYKWCNKKVTVSAKVTGNKVQLTIEDDGSGINEEARKRILLRGQRADQNTPGQGLGLAIVTDILVLYKGNMEISKSATGGAKITIEL